MLILLVLVFPLLFAGEAFDPPVCGNFPTAHVDKRCESQARAWSPTDPRW
jgi:hypothetical protein